MAKKMPSEQLHTLKECLMEISVHRQKSGNTMIGFQKEKYYRQLRSASAFTRWCSKRLYGVWRNTDPTCIGILPKTQMSLDRL